MFSKIHRLYQILAEDGLIKLLCYLFYRVRNGICRVELILRGVRVGRDNFYYGRVETIFHNGGKIKLGSRNNFAKYVLFKVGPKGEIIVGNSCTISRFCFLQASSKIVLEDGVILAPFVHIVDSDHNIEEKSDLPIRKLDEIKGIKTSPITIKRNAWIGSSSVVLKGVTIGEGAVVGAGSVVTRDIPANAVAVGVPCKVIKMRK
ncbi:MAG: acyltransferase [Candidatus Omnitrophica bacterium]|nr:acyltransferase [Candidatus Omnitrophota bacterium]